MAKLYFYVDETGRDPFSTAFIAGILVTGQKRDELAADLLELERTSKKNDAKWHKAHYLRRRAYIEGILKISSLTNNIFFHTVQGGKDYLAYTADGTINVIRQKARSGDQSTVYFDGFTSTEVSKMKRQLRPSLKGKRLIVKSIKRDESSSLIRLADAICGLVRDANEGQEWAKEVVEKLKRKGILKEI